MIEPTELHKAKLLLASIRAALANGCRHYNKAGTLLATEKEIVACLQAEGGVMIDETDRKHVTTVQAEMAKLCASLS
jgi:hypothetical protein